LQAEPNPFNAAAAGHRPTPLSPLPLQLVTEPTGKHNDAVDTGCNELAMQRFLILFVPITAHDNGASRAGAACLDHAVLPRRTGCQSLGNDANRESLSECEAARGRVGTESNFACRLDGCFRSSLTLTVPLMIRDTVLAETPASRANHP